jgi:hypothetical protein
LELKKKLHHFKINKEKLKKWRKEKATSELGHITILQKLKIASSR